VREINTVLAKDGLQSDNQKSVLEAIEKFDSVLGIFGKETAEILDEEIEALIEERQEARRNRNFARSDEIRDLLAEKGIILEDTKDGVRWKRKQPEWIKSKAELSACSSAMRSVCRMNFTHGRKFRLLTKSNLNRPSGFAAHTPEFRPELTRTTAHKP